VIPDGVPGQPPCPRITCGRYVWHPGPVTRPHRARPRLRVAATALASLALAACSGGGSSPGPSTSTAPPDAAALLATARQKLDAAPSAHFTLSSADVPAQGTALIGGVGDAARPDRFKGDLDVRVAGAQVRVAVVSIGGTVYAKLPLTNSFGKVDPAQIGISDPGLLLSPESGVTQLLAKAREPRLGGTTRLFAEVLQEVRAEIPGEVVDQILASADPATPMTGVFGIVQGSGELRRATLTGPFTAKGTNSTYTIVLEKYGAQVDISAPSS